MNYAGLGDAFCGMISSTSAWAGQGERRRAGYDIAVRIHADETHFAGLWLVRWQLLAFGTDVDLSGPNMFFHCIRGRGRHGLRGWSPATSDDFDYPDPQLTGCIRALRQKFPMRYTVMMLSAAPNASGVLGSSRA